MQMSSRKHIKPSVSSLELELTRKCNMTCLHCMRGDAQNLSMSDDVIRAAFSKIRCAQTVLLTGGEVSMVPDRIRAVTRIAREQGVGIDSFHIVTNGKSIGPRFIDAVSELYDYCDEKETCSVAYSNDEFHDELGPRQFAALERLARVGTENSDDYVRFLSARYSKRTGYNDFDNSIYSGYVKRHDGSDLIAMGRGNENFPARGARLNKFYFDDEYDNIEGDVYVAANGRLLPGCDLSYAAIDFCSDLYMGSVLDPKLDLTRACKRFNAHMLKWLGKDSNVSIHEYDLEING